MDNTLAYIDQASFLGFRALGRGPLIQLTWIYEHAVDTDGLLRFQHALGQGMLGRRIERSPLPFGRHRWVSWQPPTTIDVHPEPRPRSDLPAWIEQRRATPIDAELGPPWHLGVLPLTEGGAAVSLVVSHTVADGVGITIAVADAVNGVAASPGYPPAASRRRAAAIREDLRQTGRGLRGAAAALVSAVQVARANRSAVGGSMRTPPPPPGEAPGSPVSVPLVTMYADAAHWDERARSLGGTSNSLFLGLGARLGALLGRLRADGSVELAVPVNERQPGDLAGNALTGVTVFVDPSSVTTDLRDVRGALKSVLSGLGEARHQLVAPLPLTPFVPKAVARRLSGVALGSSAVIGCSNIGEVDAAVNRPDGTDAEFFSIRAMESRITRGEIVRQAGLMFMMSARVHGQVSVTVSFADPSGSNSRDDLLRVLSRAVRDFGLSATVT